MFKNFRDFLQFLVAFFVPKIFVLRAGFFFVLAPIFLFIFKALP